MGKSIMDMLKEYAELHKDDAAEPVEANLVYFCDECHENQVSADSGLCPRCLEDLKRGYAVRSLAGRCANGAERDHGTRFHALLPGEYKAVCGAQPGKRSAGWSSWAGDKNEVTCPKCLARLDKHLAAADQRDEDEQNYNNIVEGGLRA